MVHATAVLPLFPLNTVLCPGVALPLHIFETRYRLMVGRCMERGEPFGVVLLREGRETGPFSGRIAEVGTTAAIRQVGRYPDGRYDIVTVGERRFRILEVDADTEPYLLGRVVLLDGPAEPSGGEGVLLARRVGQRFLAYLERLQVDLPPGSPEVEVEVELELDTTLHPHGTGAGSLPDHPDDPEAAALDAGVAPLDPPFDAGDLDDRERRDLLMSAARRLVGTGDPTALSYLVTALVQVEVAVRQALLEAPDTVARLTRLDELLTREMRFLHRDLRPLVIDPNSLGRRRN